MSDDPKRFARKHPPKPTSDPQLGVNMKAHRRALGLSQKDLAAKMRERGRENWHQNTVSRIELGQQAIVNLGDVRALQDILGVDVAAGSSFSTAFHGAFNERTMLSRARAMLQQIQESVDELGEFLDHLEQQDGDGTAS